MEAASQYCQPLFVLTGCLLLNYFSLLRDGHSPTPALQPFFALTGVLHFSPGYQLHILITPWINIKIALVCEYCRIKKYLAVTH